MKVVQKLQGSITTEKKLSIIRVTVTYSFIPLACAECDDSLPFSGVSSIPLCCVLFLAILLHQLFFHPVSFAIYFLFYLSVLLFPNSYVILFWEIYFLPFSVTDIHSNKFLYHGTSYSSLGYISLLIVRSWEHCEYILIIKPTRCTNFSNLFLE